MFNRTQFQITESKVLIAEISELAIGLNLLGAWIAIDDRVYNYVKTDRLGGDVTGWWYQHADGEKVFILND